MPKTVLLQLPDNLYEAVIKFLERDKKNLNDWIISLVQDTVAKKNFYASEGKFYQSQLSFKENEPPKTEPQIFND
jgi:hypothetical protein